MIRNRSRQNLRGDVSLDNAMTPMIDVVFLLLVFFVCTASFRLIEQMLPGTLSSQAAGSTDTTQSTPDPQSDFEQVIVRVGWSNNAPVWTVNDQAVPDAGQLRAVLETLAKIKADARLILHPEPDVPLEYVINAWDWSRLAGFQTVAFAVNKSR